MQQVGEERVQGILSGSGRSRQGDDDGRTRHAGNRATQHCGGNPIHRVASETLFYPGQSPIQQFLHRLRCDIARGNSAPTRNENDVNSLADPLGEGSLDLLCLVGNDPVLDDTSAESFKTAE